MLRLQNISKYFPGVKALQNISLPFAKGEVHALCGENGAGKSTLMNIIMGNLQPDEGTIFFNEEPVRIPDVLAAQRLGISIVYQERSLANALSIAENMFPVHLPLTKAGFIDYPALYKRSKQLLDELGLGGLSPKTLVSKLSVAQKQMVEIAKAIAQKPSLLILDEPTASITGSETKILFRIIRQLKEKDVGIIYISHRMAEIREIADTISVLKDGKFVGTYNSDMPAQQIINLMVGRELQAVNAASHMQKEIRLEVKSIYGNGFSNVSFILHKGEILGLSGLEGSGRTEVARAIFGDQMINKGTFLKDGKPFQATHPAEAISGHIIYVPEERKSEGLFLEKSISENIFSSQLKKGFYRQTNVNRVSKKLCTDFDIRTPTIKQLVRNLSGGNQQKVVLAKWLALEPDILIVNEPTHGVDVGAKAAIYQLLIKNAAEGKSILLISSELTELLLLCDHIGVMHEGKLQGILSRQEATEEKIATLASGINN